MFTVTLILVIAALITAIAAAMQKCPLWVAVILLCIAHLVTVVPVK